MLDRIESLSSKQAISAIRSLYDLLPPSLWEGGKKPAAARVENVAARLQEEAPPDLKPAIEALLTAGDSAEAGQVAKLLLDRFAGSATFRPFVEQAMTVAEAPAMAFDPVTGGFILAMLLLSSKFEKTPDGWKFTGGAPDLLRELRLPELLDKLPAVLKALPESILTKLLGLGAGLGHGTD
jgi:hypothetical protein